LPPFSPPSLFSYLTGNPHAEYTRWKDPHFFFARGAATWLFLTFTRSPLSPQVWIHPLRHGSPFFPSTSRFFRFPRLSFPPSRSIAGPRPPRENLFFYPPPSYVVRIPPPPRDECGSQTVILLLFFSFSVVSCPDFEVLFDYPVRFWPDSPITGPESDMLCTCFFDRSLSPSLVFHLVPWAAFLGVTPPSNRLLLSFLSPWAISTYPFSSPVSTPMSHCSLYLLSPVPLNKAFDIVDFFKAPYGTGLIFSSPSFL